MIHISPRFDLFLFTTPNCGLFKFTVYGNRVLQASTVLAILYFNLLAVYLKTSKCETIGRQLFPVIVLVLLLIELATTLPPALNVRADDSQRFLHRVTHPFYQMVSSRISSCEYGVICNLFVLDGASW